MMEGIPYRPDPFGETWVIGIQLFALLLLTWVRVSYPLKLQRVLECVRAPHFLRQFVREEHPLGHPASLGLFLIPVSIGGLLLYQSDLYYGWEFVRQGLGGYAWYALIVAGAFLIKFLSLGVLRFFIGNDPGIREYLFHFTLLFQAIGIILFPLTLFISFMGALPKEWNFVPAFALSGIAFFLLLIRAIGIARNHSVPPFYIFLYLCAFEILPLIVLSKALIDQN